MNNIEQELDIYKSFSIAIFAKLSEVVAEAEEKALQQALSESDKAVLVLSEKRGRNYFNAVGGMIFWWLSF